MVTPEFLTLEDVELLHREQLRLLGGLDGVRDHGALESAVAVPASSFGGEFLHVGLFAMASAGVQQAEFSLLFASDDSSADRLSPGRGRDVT